MELVNNDSRLLLVEKKRKKERKQTKISSGHLHSSLHGVSHNFGKGI